MVDGTTYSAPVTPVVTITDAHPDVQAVTLDGLAFASGTTVSAEGAHVLAVHAADAAGNASDATVHFSIAAASGIQQTAGGRSVRILALIRAGETLAGPAAHPARAR